MTPKFIAPCTFCNMGHLLGQLMLWFWTTTAGKCGFSWTSVSANYEKGAEKLTIVFVCLSPFVCSSENVARTRKQDAQRGANAGRQEWSRVAGQRKHCGAKLCGIFFLVETQN